MGRAYPGGMDIEWRGITVVTRAAVLQVERRPDVETRIQSSVFLDNVQRVALLEESGFAAVNWSASMRKRLLPRSTLQDPGPTWPDGMRLETYELRHSEKVRAAHNSAFLDHWGFVPWDVEMWRRREDESTNARHPMSWLLVHEDRPELVVGYLMSHEYEAYQEATGKREAYLAKIGVRREFRGRGIASGLLRHALRRYTEAATTSPASTSTPAARQAPSDCTSGLATRSRSAPRPTSVVSRRSRR